MGQILHKNSADTPAYPIVRKILVSYGHWSTVEGSLGAETLEKQRARHRSIPVLWEDIGFDRGLVEGTGF